MLQRKSGILLHITSLPSNFGIGDLGPSSYRFADFLRVSGQQVWQILPLNPSGTFVGSSPYASYSAFAGNPLLISPEELHREGLVTAEELAAAVLPQSERVNFSAVIEAKTRLLQAAYDRFRQHRSQEYEKFCKENKDWLDDYGLFVALKQHFKEVAWVDWPVEIRDRDEAALKMWREKLADRIDRAKFFQFLFFHQWNTLKRYCSSKNVKIFGDMPIYVSNDSVDVWAHPELFKLDEHKRPLFVSGAPPDYFSATGQRWGSPVYKWDVLKKKHFSWWLRRIGHNLKLFDMVRLDHFRGFVAYWEIPATEETAVKGKWVEAPAMELFEAVKEALSGCHDYCRRSGTDNAMTSGKSCQIPVSGMKILQFALVLNSPPIPTFPIIMRKIPLSIQERTTTIRYAAGTKMKQAKMTSVGWPSISAGKLLSISCTGI